MIEESSDFDGFVEPFFIELLFRHRSDWYVIYIDEFRLFTKFLCPSLNQALLPLLPLKLPSISPDSVI